MTKAEIIEDIVQKTGIARKVFHRESRDCIYCFNI